MNRRILRHTSLFAALVGAVALIAPADAPAQSMQPIPAPPRPPRPVNPPAHFSVTDIPASDAEAARFLTMATFGPTSADIALVRQIGYRAWIAQQLALPATPQRPYVEALDQAVQNPGQNDRMQAWFANSVTAPDQLRQRMAFALSQIMVVSDQFAGNINDPIALAEYYDTLARDSAETIDGSGVRHAPTYYNLITDITLSPSMGHMLTYIRNQKGNPATGTTPDENYAREVMQLFSIGLEMLNPDGSLMLDASGQPIPTYPQSTVTAYARVFTGWSYSTGFTSNPANSQKWSVAEYQPLVCYDTYHDFGAKTLLSYTGNYGANSDAKSLPANLSCQDDLKQGLAILAAHPNVAPYISKQLIQRFVTSNPTPAYVARISAVFNSSGGDLARVITAILTDSEAMSGQIAAPYQGSYVFGKIREPLLRLTALWRYYNAKSTSGLYTFNNPQGAYAQRPEGASSVFNFYSPFYAPPGELGAAGQVAPELQILNESTVISTANDLTSRIAAYVGNSSNTAATIAIDLSGLAALAGDANALVDQVNHDLMYGRMSATTRTQLVSAANAVSASTPTARAQVVLQLALVAPEFAIQL